MKSISASRLEMNGTSTQRQTMDTKNLNPKDSFIESDTGMKYIWDGDSWEQTSLGGSVIWSPLSLSMLVAWYRADTLVTDNPGLVDGGNITTWSDGKASFDLTVGGGTPNYVASAVNGKPAVHCVTGEWLRNVALNIANGYKVYAIMRKTAEALGQTVMGANSGIAQYRTRIIGSAPGYEYQVVTGGTNAFNDNETIAINTWLTLGMQYGVNPAAQGLDYNNANAGSNTTGTAITGTGINFNAENGGATSGSNDFAEILVLSSAPAGADLTNLFSYINSRYGL